MSSLDLHLAAEIRSARAALARAGIWSGHPFWLAAERAADCLADLERAQRLLASERSSAEAALRGLEREASLFQIAAEQQRRTDEAADLAEAEAARKALAAGIAENATRHARHERRREREIEAAARKKGGAL